MHPKDDVERLKESLRRSEHVQAELDRRVFHLKTLYDISKDIFGAVDFEAILKNFLLMTTGNFGVIEGFILTHDFASKRTSHFVSLGFRDNERTKLSEGGRQLLQGWDLEESILDGYKLEGLGISPQTVACVLPFSVDEGCSGLLGLGSKIVGEPYSDDDKDLLVTLVNSLVVSLRNARSFEDIKRLNLELQEKNKELRAALKKVELLESIKANLSKFVPTTVTRLIERSPTGEIHDSKERDVSVLFLDIEGYTKITERIGATEVNRLIERYFSVFMDAIYANNGDVNETAGDGLMVLFLSEDEKTHALEAVRAALTIREKTALINKEESALSEPLLINMGICSGQAFVGAAKFDSYTGSRWTYTSHGTTTNVAARICSHATGGAVMLSRSTADRVKGHFSMKPLGKFSLKNVSEEVEIFAA